MAHNWQSVCCATIRTRVCIPKVLVKDPGVVVAYIHKSTAREQWRQLYFWNLLTSCSNQSVLVSEREPILIIWKAIEEVSHNLPTHVQM